MQFTVAESERQAEARKSTYQYMVDTAEEEPWQHCTLRTPILPEEFKAAQRSNAMQEDDDDGDIIEAARATASIDYALMQEHWFPTSTGQRGTWMRPAAVHQVQRRTRCPFCGRVQRIT